MKLRGIGGIEPPHTTRRWHEPKTYWNPKKDFHIMTKEEFCRKLREDLDARRRA